MGMTSDQCGETNFAGISAFGRLADLPSAVIWSCMPLGYTRQTIFA